MNILLVLPRVFVNLSEPEHFPVGMALVSSCLKKAGHHVEILNLNFEKGDVYQILENKIEENDFDIVETGGLVTHYWMIKQIVDSVKLINKSIYTLVGGGFVTGDPELAMEAIPNIDFGVFGEGEITNNEVSRAIVGEIKFSDIDGLIYRERFENKSIERSDYNKCKKNNPRKEIENLDMIPWPDYEGFQLDKMLEYAPKKYVTMSTGRSCKFRCTFCFHTSGQRYRQRSLNSFFEELDFLVSNYGIDNIYVTDELFADDFERLNEFCTRIKDYKILWSIQLRVNIVTKPLLQLLKDSGCIIISFGLESADNRILRSMRKGITVEMIENALRCSYEVGIEAHGAFIFGDIEEDEESINNTLRWWREHREYNVSLALIQVYPGTYLYKYACENGIIKDKIKFLEQGCPYINVSKLTDQQYVELGLRLQNEMTRVCDDIEEIIETEYLQRNRINIKARCKKCGSEIVGSRCSIYAPKIIKCGQCNKEYTYNPYLHFKESVNENFVNIFKKSKKLAFWGSNDVLSAILRALPCLENYDYDIIGSNNIIVNQAFMGRIVKSEEILEKNEIDTVIVCDFRMNTYIKNYIKTRYKNKNVIDLEKLHR